MRPISNASFLGGALLLSAAIVVAAFLLSGGTAASQGPPEQAQGGSVQATLAEMTATLGEMKKTLGEVKETADELNASDSEILDVQGCFEVNGGLEGEYKFAGKAKAKGQGAVGLDLGTGAKLAVDVAVESKFSAALAGEGKLSLVVCADLRNLVESFGSSASTGSGALPNADVTAAASDDELAAMLTEFWRDRGLLSEGLEFDTAKVAALVDGISNFDASTPDGFLSLDAPLIANVATLVPLPDSVAAMFANPRGTIDDFFLSVRDQLDFCPVHATAVPSSMAEFLERICSIAISDDDLTGLFETIELIKDQLPDVESVTAAYNEMCTSTNEFLGTLRSTAVSSPGATIDFGSRLVMTGATLTPQTETIPAFGIKVLTGVTLTPQREPVGIGERTVGNFSVTPFAGLPTSVCSTIID